MQDKKLVCNFFGCLSSFELSLVCPLLIFPNALSCKIANCIVLLYLFVCAGGAVLKKVTKERKRQTEGKNTSEEPRKKISLFKKFNAAPSFFQLYINTNCIKEAGNSNFFKTTMSYKYTNCTKFRQDRFCYNVFKWIYSYIP